jgi:hypothetical protein
MPNTPFNNPASGAIFEAEVFLSASHITFLLPIVIAFYRGKFGYAFVFVIATVTSTFYHLTQTDFEETIFGIGTDGWARADLFTALWALIIITLYILKMSNDELTVQYYTMILAFVWMVWISVPNTIVEYTQAGMSVIIIALYVWMRYGKHVEARVYWPFRLSAYAIVLCAVALQIVATFVEDPNVYAWAHGSWHVGISIGAALIFWPGEHVSRFHNNKAVAEGGYAGSTQTYAKNMYTGVAPPVLRENMLAPPHRYIDQSQMAQQQQMQQQQQIRQPGMPPPSTDDILQSLIPSRARNNNNNNLVYNTNHHNKVAAAAVNLTNTILTTKQPQTYTRDLKRHQVQGYNVIV